jgi:CheY-like chemotaxis protein
MEKKKVLIIDDDIVVLETAKMILEQHGYDVSTKSDANHVEEDASTVHPDVVLMDYKLPGISGVEAISLLKHNEELKDIPVILFTIFNEIESKAKEAGADAFLQKPFQITDLENIVDFYLMN